MRPGTGRETFCLFCKAVHVGSTADITVMPVSMFCAIWSLSNRIYMLPFSTFAVPVAKLSISAAELQIRSPERSRTTAVRISHTAGPVTRR